MRIATYNLENLDDRPGERPDLAERIRALRPHLVRLRADVLCLQEINAQGQGEDRRLAALDRLLEGTDYAGFHRAVTLNETGAKVRDVQNLVILSRLPIVESRQVCHDLVAPVDYRPVTAEPPAAGPGPVRFDRPILWARLDAGGGRMLHVVNLHLRAPLAAVVAGQKAAPFVWRSVAGWAEGYFLAAVKRVGQALECRLMIEFLFEAEPDALIAVAGDFNTEAQGDALVMVRSDVAETGNADLADRVLTPVELNLPEDRRFSVRHFGRTVMLDHILVSRALLGRLSRAEIHNEMLTDELVAWATGRRDADSYHAPVVAEFDLT